MLFLFEIFVMLLALCFSLSYPGYGVSLGPFISSYFVYILLVFFFRFLFDASLDVTNPCFVVLIIILIGIIISLVSFTFSNFNYQHMLVVIAGILLPLGPLTFYLFYTKCHAWREVNRKRIQSQCMCDCIEIEEETDNPIGQLAEENESRQVIRASKSLNDISNISNQDTSFCSNTL